VKNSKSRKLSYNSIRPKREKLKNSLKILKNRSLELSLATTAPLTVNLQWSKKRKKRAQMKERQLISLNYLTFDAMTSLIFHR
jgi:hypothetical protein